jgi:cytochrome c2
MSRFRNALFAAAAGAMIAAPALAGTYGLGREALPEEIEAWDIDVRPDGQGLPEGSGTVESGEELFLSQCASCHGDFAEGLDRWPVLAGGQDTLASADPVKTVGSYWPYLSTAYDYIYRAMPFGNAQSLSPDEVYSAIAYILYMNDLIDDEFVLSNETFLEVEMPNADGFIDDARPDTPTLASAEPCMTDCKETVEITARARIIDVTPEEESAAAEPAVETASNLDGEGVQLAAAQPELDATLVERGAKTFKKRCYSCHRVEAGDHKTGPSLAGVFNADAAAADGFTRYSKGLKELGVVWDEANLHDFLTKPNAYVKGTRMAFAGLKDFDDRAAVIEYLKSVSRTD